MGNGEIEIGSACQGYGQANQITVCVHDAKAYALRGIEAAEDSSATNLGCSNLREKQKEYPDPLPWVGCGVRD